MNHVITGLVFLSCMNSMALSGKTPPTSNGSGASQCAWYDSGKTEEHGPHLNEQDCKNRHSSCQERCFSYQQVCQAEGSRVDRTNGQVSGKDILTTYSARDQDIYRAREMALNRCYTDYPRQDNCHITSCTEESSRIR